MAKYILLYVQTIYDSSRHECVYTVCRDKTLVWLKHFQRILSFKLSAAAQLRDKRFHVVAHTPRCTRNVQIAATATDGPINKEVKKYCMQHELERMQQTCKRS